MKYKIGRVTDKSMKNILDKNIKTHVEGVKHWKYVVMFENNTMFVLGEKIHEDVMDHFLVPGIFVGNNQIKEPEFVKMSEDEEAKVILAYSPIADLLLRMYQRNGSC